MMYKKEFLALIHESYAGHSKVIDLVNHTAEPSYYELTKLVREANKSCKSSGELKDKRDKVLEQLITYQCFDDLEMRKRICPLMHLQLTMQVKDAYILKSSLCKGTIGKFSDCEKWPNKGNCWEYYLKTLKKNELNP